VLRLMRNEALRHRNAILMTHAHPDHASGLKTGASCPVYATAETWSRIHTGPIASKVVIQARSAFDLFGIGFEAFPVETFDSCAGGRI